MMNFPGTFDMVQGRDMFYIYNCPELKKKLRPHQIPPKRIFKFWVEKITFLVLVVTTIPSNELKKAIYLSEIGDSMNPS